MLGDFLCRTCSVRFAAAIIAVTLAGCASHTQAPPSGLPNVPIVPVSTQNNIDIVDGTAVNNGAVALPPGTTYLKVEGWAFDSPAKAPAKAVYASVGNTALEATYGLDRSDVARAFSAADLSRTGYRVSIPASDVPHGSSTTIDTWIVSSDGSSIYHGKSVTVSVP